MIDVHCASLTSQGVQHSVFYLDDHPSRYQPRPTGLNFGEQTGTSLFPLVIAIPLKVCTKPTSKVMLKTYKGELLVALGEMHCRIVYKGKQHYLPILVASYDAKPTWLSKNWLRHIMLEKGEVFCIPKEDPVLTVN